MEDAPRSETPETNDKEENEIVDVIVDNPQEIHTFDPLLIPDADFNQRSSGLRFQQLLQNFLKRNRRIGNVNSEFQLQSHAHLRARNPCAHCEYSREKGARVWAGYNVVLSILFLTLKLYDVIILAGNVQYQSGSYFDYLYVLYCSQSHTASVVSVIFDFLGQFISTMGGLIFISSVYMTKHDTSLRIHFCKCYIITLYISSMLFLIPKMIICVFFNGGCENVSLFFLCFILILWGATLFCWWAYGEAVSKSFITFLEFQQMRQQRQDVLNNYD